MEIREVNKSSSTLYYTILYYTLHYSILWQHNNYTEETEKKHKDKIFLRILKLTRLSYETLLTPVTK